MTTIRPAVARNTRTIIVMMTLASFSVACSATSAVPSALPSVNPASSEPVAPTPARSSAPTPAPTLIATQPSPSVSPWPQATANAEPIAWSDPLRVADATCHGRVATAIDDLGRHHIAAACDGGIRYLLWYPGAIDLQEDRRSPPAGRVEGTPQLALDGRDVLMAYSRQDQGEGACGDDGLEDLGVYVRIRSDDTGSWSEARRIGEVGDRLQSFRAVDGALHATVAASDGRVFYDVTSDERVRVRIPDAVETSLRVGDDGRARIAYSTGSAIYFARVDGPELTTTRIAASDSSYLRHPALVLAPGDAPTIAWMESTDSGGGCAGPDPGVSDGTYLATRTDGSWDLARVSKVIGVTSLTLGPSPGRWHAIVRDTTMGGGLMYLTGRGVDEVIEIALPGTDDVIDATVRFDPHSGDLAIVAVRAPDYDGGGEGAIDVFTSQ
jgi:hypothetical protein